MFKKKKIVFTAISTHKGEELLCAKVHNNLKKKYKNIVSVIVPRHIHRADEIKEELNLNGLKVHFHSSSSAIRKDTDIYLVDTFGETKSFLKLSKVAFMGQKIIFLLFFLLMMKNPIRLIISFYNILIIILKINLFIKLFLLKKVRLKKYFLKKNYTLDLSR